MPRPNAIATIVSNVRSMRFGLMEFSGGLGDLGTFLPLSAGMCAVAGLDFGVVLVFAGLANIVTGVAFGQPIPVQPMKAIAAVAIAERLLPNEIAAAGILAGAVLFVLGTTRAVDAIARIVPFSVVRGIQLGVGLKLAVRAVEFVGETPRLGLVVALGIAALALRRVRRFPTALMLFGAGFVVMAFDAGNGLRGMAPGLPSVSLVIPSANEWLAGLLRGAIPQLPLTLLNSVVAVCVLTGDYFPGRRIADWRMATSVGLINLLACPFGAMPMCHGSGGLAGQYHFGARTGGSVVMLGGMKVFVGLAFGAAAALAVAAYPTGILGLLLFFAGVELAAPAFDQKKPSDVFVVVATAAGIVAVNTLAGFGVGAVAAVTLGVRNRRRS